MPRVLTANIVVRTDADLKRDLERFAASHWMTASEVARIAIRGLMTKSREG